MVRVNIINPKELADQHLVAEYLEIMMLIGSIKKRIPDVTKIPNEYVLGKGHINFFKNKLGYLEKRHELIKKEMRRRGFKTNVTLDLKKFDKSLKKDWKPKKEDFEIIRKRLM